jgi:hypothetical protein
MLSVKDVKGHAYARLGVRREARVLFGPHFEHNMACGKIICGTKKRYPFAAWPRTHVQLK